MTEHLGLPVGIANDADLAAVGEAWFGAGAASHAVGYLTISTGIGAGVVHGGRLLRGPRSLAEVGHAVIDWRAWLEGAPSTLEELGSGSGVARLARHAGLGPLGAREVQAAAAAGDPRAIAIWQQAIAACAAGVSNLVMSFYPSTVVIGGGMGRQDEFSDRSERSCSNDQVTTPPTWRSSAPRSVTMPGFPAPPPGPERPPRPDPDRSSAPNDRSQEMPSAGRETSVWFLNLKQNCNTTRH